jgi:hypothetical protein
LRKGKTTFTARLGATAGTYTIGSPFLKFEDAGALGILRVAASVTSAEAEADVEVDVGEQGEGGLASNSTSPNGTIHVFDQPYLDPPQSAFHVPMSAAAQYKCAVDGSSWLYEESIDLSARTRTIVTYQCPNHYSTCQAMECGGPDATRSIRKMETITIPLYPRLTSAQPADLTCEREKVGVALNGVGFYSPADGVTDECLRPEQFALLGSCGGLGGNCIDPYVGRDSCWISGPEYGLRYCGNVVQSKGSEADKCGGHDDNSGYYKYRAPPTCLLSQLTAQGLGVYGHSPQVGWALDGFPIFVGAMGPRAVPMLPCSSTGAHPQLCLDTCNGYYGELPGFDEYMYRCVK